MNKVLRILLFSLSFLILSVNAKIQQKYDINDLKVLSENTQFKEFFDHIFDIRPSQRDESWNELVLKNAQAYLDEINNTPISKATIKEILKLHSLSFLNANDSYLSKKHNLLIKYFKFCINKEVIGDCINEAKISVTAVAKDHEYYYSLFQIFHSVQSEDTTIQSTLWSLSLPLTQDTFSEFYCKKEDFSAYLINRIAQSDNLKLHSDCIKELIEPTKKRLPSLRAPKKVIHFLLNSKLLSDEDRNYYTFMLTLTNENINDLNASEALKNLELLKNSDLLRMSVLKDIKKQIFIPDQVFRKSSDELSERTDALKRKIARSFPEFLSYYSQTCLEYLKGSKSFPLGSPTINCHNFFKEAKRLSLIDKFTISAYQDITKL